MSRTQRAFTMVELLVVITIIMILTGLLMVGIPMALSAAKRSATGQRQQNILTAIQLYGQSTGQSAYLIMRHGMRTAALNANGSVDPVNDMPDDLQWQPMRSILMSVWGGKSSGPMLGNRRGIMPNVGFSGPTSVASYVFRLADWVWVMDAAAPPLVVNAMASLQTLNQSMLGENWDSTQEVVPVNVSGTPLAPWFRARWPRVWPASDWDLPAPGRKPVRWDSPWGKEGYDPVTLAKTPAATRTLKDMSPLDTVYLLQIAGILDGGAKGAATYRTNRSPDKPWNDRWGHPLVIGSAAFIPPRAEACSRKTQNDMGAKSGATEARLNSLGLPYDNPWLYVAGSPRDTLLIRYNEDYGFNRAVYVAVGAAGPILTDPMPNPWTAAEDPVALRNLWLQIGTICQAQEWDEKSFTRPPWSGVRTGRKGTMRSQLSAPIEIK